MSSQYSNYLKHSHLQVGQSHDDINQNNLDYQIKNKKHDHNHRIQNGKVLLWCLIITFSFSIIEGIGGYFTNSIALQSDALHMLTDAASLLIAYIANNISKRPATVNLTFGYGNAESIGALINCIFTIVLTCGLLFEIFHRFFVPVTVEGVGVFIIASIGLLINGIVVLILSSYSHSLNIEAALIHALGDLLGSVVAIVAGGLIYVTGISVFDPILSLIVVFLLLISNYKIIKKSLVILMAGVPEDLDYIQIGLDIEKIDGVFAIHDLHIWYMSTNKASLSAHIVEDDGYSGQDSLLKCQKMLLDKYGIEHITLQYESKIDYLKMNHCISH